MMIKQPMTKRFAIAYLEGEYESIYRGIKTVYELNKERGLGTVSYTHLRAHETV